MEYKGIKEGDWVEAIHTSRRFDVEPAPWGNESWTDRTHHGRVTVRKDGSAHALYLLDKRLDAYAEVKKADIDKPVDPAVNKASSYEFGPGGKRVPIGTRRKEWIMAQRKLESKGHKYGDVKTPCGDWRRYVTKHTYQDDLKQGILSEPTDSKFIRDTKEGKRG